MCHSLIDLYYWGLNKISIERNQSDKNSFSNNPSTRIVSGSVAKQNELPSNAMNKSKRICFVNKNSTI